MDLYAIDVGAGTDANFGGFCTVNDGFGGGDEVTEVSELNLRLC